MTEKLVKNYFKKFNTQHYHLGPVLEFTLHI